MDTLPVAIAGPRDSGKTTVARMLRDALEAKSYRVAVVETNTVFYAKVAASFGMPAHWLEVRKKEDPFVRFVLEQAGVFMRKEDPEFLYNHIIKEITTYNCCDFVIISGVRRLGETAAVKKMGGVVVRLYRQTGYPCEPSEDELAYLPHDFTIDNNGNLTALENSVELLVNWLIDAKGKLL